MRPPRAMDHPGSSGRYSSMCLGIPVSNDLDIHISSSYFLVSLYKTVNDNTGLGTVNDVNDMPVGSVNGKRMNCPFNCGIINRHITVHKKRRQRLLLL